MKLVYPACFYPCEDGKGYTVVVPDLPGCVTQGQDLADAMEMATDAASGWVLDSLEEGDKIPAPSDRKSIKLEYEDGFVNLIVLDMDSYAEKYGSNAVRKNCTLPAWMDTLATQQGANFSQLLQQAVEAYLHIYK